MKSTIKIIIASIFMCCISCSSDDDSNTSETPIISDGCTPETIANQVAKGKFMGEDFVSPGGDYKVFGSSHQATIYVRNLISSTCFPSEFEGEFKDYIAFDMGEDISTAQTITLSFENSVSFSRNQGSTSLVDVAVCGVIHLNPVQNDVITGSIYASYDASSIVEGNFSLDLCEF